MNFLEARFAVQHALITLLNTNFSDVLRAAISIGQSFFFQAVFGRLVDATNIAEDMHGRFAIGVIPKTALLNAHAFVLKQHH